MSPGTITGWPTSLYLSGMPPLPEGKDRGCTLAVDAQLHVLAVHGVALYLGDIVGDVVDLSYSHLRPAFVEDLTEGLPCPVGDALPVGPGEVGGTPHGAEVALTFRRGDWYGSELSVGENDLVLFRTPARLSSGSPYISDVRSRGSHSASSR